MFPPHPDKVLSLGSLNALYSREMPDSDSSLYKAAKYHFRNPGKAYRAQLALTSGTALGLNEQDNLHWAASCELLHNASLIHDDISDASTFRRGQESIHEHFGSDVALCLGDWMIAKAFELAARNSAHGGELAGILAKSMQETCGGQMSDISQRHCAVLDDWQRIANGKTAPLLIAPIKGAAIAAGFGNDIYGLQSLESSVGLCGLAYQGRNDIDDIIPSSHRSSDLGGRKPNLVVSLFAQQGLGRDDFISWYQSDDNTLLPQWQRRIASSDMILQANQFVDSWLEQAEQLISELPAQLQPVVHELVCLHKAGATIRRQERIA